MLNSEVPCNQPTTPDNIQKLNTYTFGEQTHQFFVHDTEELAHFYNNFIMMYQLQRLSFGTFNSGSDNTLDYRSQARISLYQGHF